MRAGGARPVAVSVLTPALPPLPPAGERRGPAEHVAVCWTGREGPPVPRLGCPAAGGRHCCRRRVAAGARAEGMAAARGGL